MALIAGVAGLGFALLLGLPLTVLSVQQIRYSASVRNATWQDVIDLDGGHAKLEGRVADDGETIAAPFTGRECVVVEAAIERYQTAGSTNGWEADHTELKSGPFTLEDPTGSVTVDPSGAELSLATDHEHLIEVAEKPTGPYAEFVDEHDIYIFDDEGVSEAQELKFVERRIEPGDEIAVFGPVDDSGVQRRIRDGDGGWFASSLFSIADDRDELTTSVGTGIISLLFSLTFLVGGLGFAWLGLSRAVGV